MSATFNRAPSIPEELVDAAASGMLVVFIGAGISRLVGCPSWNEFASAVLNQLTPDIINYHEKSLIDSIPDPRKKLSIAKILEQKHDIKIDYKRIFNIDEPKSNIYEDINSLKCTFVTTNYDKLISPEISKTRPEKEWRFYKREDILRNKLDSQGSVIHLHGCVDDSKSMVITTKDYLLHYVSEEIHAFLQYMFESKTVLFLGYGLEEIEVLEYILKGSKQLDSKERKMFILQGFFNAEMSLFEKLKEYYDQSFNATLIGFPKDYIEYEQQKDIIKDWLKELSFSPLELVDELKLMEEELND